MSDDIIHLSDYLVGQREQTTFSVHGGDGERSRFALPVWRAVYLLKGDRGGIVWTDAAGGAPRTFFVLDLATDPARKKVPAEVIAGLTGKEPPSVDVRDGSVAVLLARNQHRCWYMVVTGRDPDGREPTGEEREDLLFLAGECTGLLLHRELASDG